MSAGTMGKCKDCTKKASKARWDKMKQNPDWVLKEKKRARDKYRRLYSDGRHKPTKEEKRVIMKAYSERYPEKLKAKTVSCRIKKMDKTNELHHWSYNEEHYKDVIELSRKHHSKAHVYTIYDQEQKMYRRYDTNELLNTKEKHLHFITHCIQNLPD